MLLPGTQMHIVTFIFVCIEIVILFYLIIYRFARPDDKTGFLNIILIALLIFYNVTGGLFPDTNLPIPIFLQEVIAYGTGFITPCFFPYYVFRAFGLEKMKFHAFKGVFLFLMLPYVWFVSVYAITHDLQFAKNLLAMPVVYALWVVITLFGAIRYKYRNFNNPDSREEATVLILSITPWIGLPFIDYFNLSQAIEASITNPGFLLLLGLQVNRHIKQIKKEHQGLIDSELRLMNWNENLQKEVDKRTKEVEKIADQKTNAFVNLAHETKTPLTLINNYLEEYINTKGNSEELSIVRKNIDKLCVDIVNFFDLEKFNKGFAVYNHNQITNFSELLTDDIILFKEYAKKKNIELQDLVEQKIFIKADPVAVNRVVINLIENAIKFSCGGCVVKISLETDNDKIIFSVKDNGAGIPPEMHKKIFAPYYQISSQKGSTQGMGLGLPIVKKVVEDLAGEIEIESDPVVAQGTVIKVILSKYDITDDEVIAPKIINTNILSHYEEVILQEETFVKDRQTILLLEDNISMINYLSRKLRTKYNVHTALNGSEGIKKIKSLSVIPDLIISDVMMDRMDGYAFAKILSKEPSLKHIPIIFLSAKSGKLERLQGLQSGAIDFIAKPFNIHELMQKVESFLINAGRQKQAFMTAAISSFQLQDASFLKSNADIFTANCDHFRLTTREKDIAKLICEGKSYKEIAASLFIADRTVSTHAENIFEKLNVTNKIEMIKKLEE